MAWLGTWAKRIEIEIDNTNIDSDLTHFPVLIKLGHDVGKDGQDTGSVFDELTTNHLKIAVTDEDGTTQLYVEVDKWDNTVPEAFLWVSLSTFVVHNDRPTRLYLYYDSAQDDNTTYVGVPNDVVCENVWDANYVLVDHMQDGASNAATYDSTSNDNDGAKLGANEPIEIVGKVGDAQDYDSVDDLITVTDAASIQNIFNGGGTVEAIINPTSDGEGSLGDIINKLGWIFNVEQESASKVKLSFFRDWVTTNGIWKTGLDVDIAEFTYVAVSYDDDATTNDPVIYVAGESVAVTETTGPPAGARVTDVGDDLIVGNLAIGVATFDGVLDEIRVSDTTRSAAWIKATKHTCFDTLISYNLCGDWLSGWKQRIAITVDSSLIDSDLTHFPLMVRISAETGASEQDLTRVFDEVGVEDLKIAITDDTGVQQLYVEVEKWDSTNEEAILWVSRADWVIDSSADTVIYLYYDADKDDNTYFVGVTNSTPAERVWDSDYMLVDHMQDGADNAHTRDSTSNDNDGTKKGANEPLEVAGMIGEDQDFDGNDDYLSIPITDLDISQGTLDIIFKIDENLNAQSDLFSISRNADAVLTMIAVMVEQRAANPDYSLYVFLLIGGVNQWGIRVPSTTFESRTDFDYHHLQLTHNGTTATLYLDDVDVTAYYAETDKTKWWDALFAAASPSDSAQFGARRTNGAYERFFSGKIDEARISDDDRSTSWCSTVYDTCFDNLLTFATETDTWKAGWDKRIKLTVSKTNIDEALEWFPLMIRISASCGASSQDMTRVFDELGVEDLKIAITEADGQTDLYVEVEKWDSTAEEAILWVSRDGFYFSSIVDTVLYLYYDADHADNSTYVGVTNSVVAESVWDANFLMVQHMADGASNAATYDSTSNDNDGAKLGANEPIEATGEIGEAQDFDNNDDFIETATPIIPTTDFTISALVNVDDFATYQAVIGQIDAVEVGRLQFLIEQTTGKIYLQITTAEVSDSAITAAIWQAVDITRSGSTVTFYNHGDPDGTATLADNVSQDDVVEIGRATANRMLGMIDEVRISDVARSAAWVKATKQTAFDSLITFSIEGETIPEVLIDIAWVGNAMADTPDWYAVDSAGGSDQACTRYHFKKGRLHALARMQTGQADFVLKNFDGYYWPDKVNGPWYPYVTAGKKIRIRCVYDGTLYPRFVGFIDEWLPSWIGSPNIGAIMTITATDGMEHISNTKLNNAGEAQELSGTRIDNVLDKAGWPAADRDTSPGAETLQATGAQADVNAMDHINKVNNSELGILFVAFDGDMTWHGRAVRDASPYDVPLATFGDDLSEMPYVRLKSVIDRELLYNEVRLTIIGGIEQTVEDTTSQDTYGKRTLTRTGLLNLLDSQAEVICGYLVGRYKNATTLRVQQIILLPRSEAANLFPKAFLYDISTRITCRLNEAKLDRDYFIEGVEEKAEASTINWQTSWQLSDVTQQLATPETLDITLRPTGPGSHTGIPGSTPDTGEAHWEDVDDVTPDEDTTTVWDTTNVHVDYDVYNLNNPSLGAGTINSVTVYARCKNVEGTGGTSFATKLRTVATDYTGAATDSAAYVDTSTVYALNPNTGLAWTSAQIDALQAGVQMSLNTTGGSVVCTQVYVVVNFTPAW